MNCILAKGLLNERRIGSILFYSIDDSTAKRIEAFCKTLGVNPKIDFYYENNHASVNYLIGHDGWMTIHYVSSSEDLNKVILVISGVLRILGRGYSAMNQDLCIALLFLKANIQATAEGCPMQIKEMLKENSDKLFKVIKGSYNLGGEPIAKAYKEVLRINGILAKERNQYENAMNQYDNDLREAKNKLRNNAFQEDDWKFRRWHAIEQKMKAKKIYNMKRLVLENERDNLMNISKSLSMIKMSCISKFQWDLKPIRSHAFKKMV